MATLKCKVCGTGIHYNSEPSGIECIFVKKEDWMLICDSRFIAKNKEMDTQGAYPKLYRSDTIEEDFSDKILKCWKCPECGSVYVFDEKGNVISTYQKTEERSDELMICEGILFDDYSWDRITELSMPDIELKSVTPTYYIRCYQYSFIVSEDKDFSDCKYAYKKVHPTDGDCDDCK